jgi:hypothetical protein
MLKRRPHAVRAMLEAQATDSVGRTRTARERVVLRR